MLRIGIHWNTKMVWRWFLPSKSTRFTGGTWHVHISPTSWWRLCVLTMCVMMVGTQRNELEAKCSVVVLFIQIKSVCEQLSVVQLYMVNCFILNHGKIQLLFNRPNYQVWSCQCISVLFPRAINLNKLPQILPEAGPLSSPFLRINVTSSHKS